MGYIKKYYAGLLVIYLTLHLYVNNFDSVQLFSFLKVLGIALSLFFIFDKVLRKFTQASDVKVSLISFILCFIALTLGHWYFFLNTTFILYNPYFANDWHHTQKNDLQNFFKILYLLFAVFGVYKVKKSKDESVEKIGNFLSVFSLILVCMSLVQFMGTFFANSNGGVVEKNDSSSLEKESLSFADRPDIFFIIYDGYPSGEVLKKYYDFDNSDLIKQLEEKDFFIPDVSYSNYNTTYQSIASILNMEYHDELYKKMGKKNRNRRPLLEKIQNNKVIKFLKNKGYDYYHLQSYYSGLRENKYADKVFNCSRDLDSAYWELFKNSSALLIFSQKFKGRSARVNCHETNYKTILNFSENIDKPFFTFTHFFPPHPPYLFDRKGKVLKPTVYNEEEKARKVHWSNKTPFISQLEFMNIQMISIVDKLMMRKRKPVIVIMSDHGTRLIIEDKKEAKSMTYSNFTAIYTPKKKISYNGVLSANNVLRLTFNHLFDSKLKLLDLKHIFSSYGHPYKGERVDPEYFKKKPQNME